MITDTNRRRSRVIIASAVTATALTFTAGAQARATIRDCGDISAAGASAITAQGVACKSARAVARVVPARKTCGPFPTSGGCTVRGFTCLVGQAGKELFLVTCQDAHQARFIRFEYGS
jgi:hypothetical protein